MKIISNGWTMIRKTLHIGLAAIIAMVSCTKPMEEMQDTDKANLVSVTIAAEAEQGDTRIGFSVKDYPALEWKAGDRISVFGTGTGNQEFIAQESGAQTTFKGLADLNDKTLYAVYPYDRNVSVVYTDNASEPEFKGIMIPTVQKVTAGSFDPKAYRATAVSNEKRFSFRTYGSFYKFRLKDASNVVSVKFTANQGADKVSLSGTDVPYVTLIEDKNGAQFADNKDYFIVAEAQKCPYGITVLITYDDGKVYKRTTSRQIFENDPRNCIMNFGVLDTDGEWLTILEQVVDFSYAGYMHGEAAPAEVEDLGYELFNVKDYGAVPDDGKSDRQAFLNALTDALGNGKMDSNGIVYDSKPDANAVIYFPEGEYILYSKEDEIDGWSPSIIIRSGNFVIKGAGRDKTILTMKDPMQPRNPSDLYSSPDMIQIKHYSGLSSATAVTGGVAAKGGFSVEVENASSISPGSWVCLHILDNDKDLVDQEIAPYSRDYGSFSLNGKPATWKILTNGVEIYDYHQVKTVKGNTVTFHEPLMHEVDPRYDWEIMSFPHYENVGVEDLTFKGYAPDDFAHHGSWIFDGGYKPLSMMRLTNSWMRRVGFESTSECCSVIGSANVSVYDVIMKGNRGHAAIRSQASSRVLIAATTDMTAGGGNFHAVGVSKQTMGTVLWRNIWGDDSCFESHANQPRATLIDCCRGGWHKGHMGGNANEAPHHLGDLTIWNFYATAGSGTFSWWDTGSWRFLPPIIVGFQSSSGVTFKAEEVACDLMHGEIPVPESLYEFQLEKRLGYIPEWLNELKHIY